MKILLIEDDPETLRVEQTVLLDAGYDVETASDAADALAKLKTIPYDGIVLDLAVDGDKLVGRIGTIDANRRAPLIVIGSGGADDRKRGFDAGATAYLNRPLTAEAFRSVIRSTLRPAAPRPARRRPAAPRPAGPRPTGPRPTTPPSVGPGMTGALPARAPRPAPVSRAPAAALPAAWPVPSPALGAIDPVAVRTHEGVVYWSEADPDGGWRCGRCETGVISSAEVGSNCPICRAVVVSLAEQPRSTLVWLIGLGLVGLLIGWAALTWWP